MDGWALAGSRPWVVGARPAALTGPHAMALATAPLGEVLWGTSGPMRSWEAACAYARAPDGPVLDGWRAVTRDATPQSQRSGHAARDKAGSGGRSQKAFAGGRFAWQSRTQETCHGPEGLVVPCLQAAPVPGRRWGRRIRSSRRRARPPRARRGRAPRPGSAPEPLGPMRAHRHTQTRMPHGERGGAGAIPRHTNSRCCSSGNAAVYSKHSLGVRRMPWCSHAWSRRAIRRSLFSLVTS